MDRATVAAERDAIDGKIALLLESDDRLGRLFGFSVGLEKYQLVDLVNGSKASLFLQHLAFGAVATDDSVPSTKSSRATATDAVEHGVLRPFATLVGPGVGVRRDDSLKLTASGTVYG